MGSVRRSSKDTIYTVCGVLNLLLGRHGIRLSISRPMRHHIFLSARSVLWPGICRRCVCGRGTLLGELSTLPRPPSRPRRTHPTPLGAMTFAPPALGSAAYTGCQSVSALCSRSRGSYISRSLKRLSRTSQTTVAFCRTLVVAHCALTPVTCGSCLCREHITNSVILGVSRPPVLDCGTTFHPDYGGRDLPSTPSDNL